MKLPRYPKYKDSGVEWLGEVPEHWEICAIKRIVDLRSGDSINSERIHEDGDYAVYGGNGFRGFTDGYTHEGHYVLIGRQGALCGNINYASDRFWASEHAVVASPLLPLKTIWLGELLRSMNLNQYSVSAAQPGLAVESIRNLQIPKPPIEEQESIERFLENELQKIDSLVSEQQRLIELLKEKRQAVISHAVTKGLNPDAPMKPSGIEWLGDVPSHWDIKRLKFIAYVQGGVAKGRNLNGQETVEVPYLRVANVQDGYLDLDEIAMIEIALTEMDRYSLHYGDVLMNEGGDFDKLGRGHIWKDEINGCVHQNHVFAVRPKLVDSEWLNLVTSAECGRFYFMTRSKQSTNLASISSSNICELPVPCPPPAEQKEIYKIVQRQVSEINDLLDSATSAIALLQERRSALISAAVTGKIDVRNLTQ